MRKNISIKSGATIIIGKSMLSEGITNEIKRQLKDKKIVKVKFLKSFVDSFKSKGLNVKNVADDISKKVNASVVKVVGFTVVLIRNKKVK